MKLIKAIIKPFKLEEVRRALEAIQIKGMVATETKGFERQVLASEALFVAQERSEYTPKLAIEVVVNDENVPRVVDAIIKAAKTSKAGDGKIFVLPVEEVIRIRTGEMGESAL